MLVVQLETSQSSTHTRDRAPWSAGLSVQLADILQFDHKFATPKLHQWLNDYFGHGQRTLGQIQIKVV